MKYMLILGIGDGTQSCIERNTESEIIDYIRKNYTTLREKYIYFYVIEFNFIATGRIHLLSEIIKDDNTTTDTSEQQ